MVRMEARHVRYNVRQRMNEVGKKREKEVREWKMDDRCTIFRNFQNSKVGGALSMANANFHSFFLKVTKKLTRLIFLRKEQ